MAGIALAIVVLLGVMAIAASSNNSDAGYWVGQDTTAPFNPYDDSNYVPLVVPVDTPVDTPVDMVAPTSGLSPVAVAIATWHGAGRRWAAG